jgi:hypothetical protein|tara:strand:+ start:142 stop:567 length:426 start_codon:yes stop_codon:yes gene_type:complete
MIRRVAMNQEPLLTTLITTILVFLPLYYLFRWVYLRDMKTREFRRKVSVRYHVIPFIYKYQLVDWCLRNLGGERYAYSKLPKQALMTIYRKEMNKIKPKRAGHLDKKQHDHGLDELKNGYFKPRSNGSLKINVSAAKNNES